MDSHPEKMVHWVRRTQTSLDLKSQFRPSSKLTTWEVQPCLHTSYNKTLHLCKIICAEALASGGLCRGSPGPYCRRLGPRSLLGASSWTQWGRALRLVHLQSQKQKSAPMSTTQSKYKTLYATWCSQMISVHTCQPWNISIALPYKVLIIRKNLRS